MPAVRKSVLIAGAALLLLAGCGDSAKVDPDQASAELGLNRGPRQFAGPAVDAAHAARRLGAGRRQGGRRQLDDRDRELQAAAAR